MSLSERVGSHLRGNAIGYVALFVALTGTSYAAHKITTNQIKRNAIVSKLIKDGQVTSADVADNGLSGADIDESTLQGVNVQLADGSVTTAKLADQAVTMPKLADAAVSQQKLAFDPATQAELDAVAAGVGPPANNSLGAAEPPAAEDQIADGSIDTQDLTDGSIVNADVAGGAAIDDSKLGTINDAGKVTDSALSSNVALLGGTQTFSGNKTFSGNLSLTDNVAATLFSTGDAFSVEAFRAGSDSVNVFGVLLNNDTTTATQIASQVVNESGSTGTTEQLLRLLNQDDAAVDTGLSVTNFGGGGFTTAIDASDAAIGTAIDIGANDIKTSGATITSTQLDKLASTQTRAVSLPVTTFTDFESIAAIDFASGADTAPDFQLLNTPVLTWDATGGSVDTNHAVVTFTVPPDYASGGAYAARISQPSAGGTAESFECAVSRNAAATGSTASVALDGSTVFPSAYTVTPPGTYAAGDSIGLTCRGLVTDNAVRLHSIEYIYQANR
jgi:hypothetical protein